MTKRPILVPLLILTVALPAWSADATWDHLGGGFWHYADNWDPGIPNGVGDVATFGPDWPTKPYSSVVVDETATIGRLEINNPQISSITGQAPLVFDMPGADGLATIKFGDISPRIRLETEVRVPDDSLLVDVTLPDTAVTWAGPINMSAGDLIKRGDGGLRIEAANSYTGATVVEGGWLRASHPQGLGNTSNVLISDGALGLAGSLAAPIALNGGRLYSSMGRRVTLSGPMELQAGGGTFRGPLKVTGVVEGGGELHITNGEVSFHVDHTYTGHTYIEEPAPGDSVRLTTYSAHALGSPEQGTTINGGTLRIRHPTLEPFHLLDGELRFEVSSQNYTHPIPIRSGELYAPPQSIFNAPLVLESATATIEGDDTIMRGGTSGAGDLFLHGDGDGMIWDGAPIAHDGRLIAERGAIWLNVANAYRGATVVDGATVLVNHVDALGTRDQGTQVKRGTLVLNQIPNEDIELDGGRLEFNDTQTPYAGTLTVVDGVLQSNGKVSGRIVLTPTDSTTPAALTLSGGKYEGSISGSGSLFVETEPSRHVDLNSSNTYFGVTSLANGTLNVNHPDSLGRSDDGTLVERGTLNLNATTSEPISLMGRGRINVNAQLPRLPSVGLEAEGTIAVNVPSTYAQPVLIRETTLEVNEDASIGGVTLAGAGADLRVASGKTLTVVSDEIELQRGTLSGRIDGLNRVRKTTESTGSIAGADGSDWELVVNQGILDLTGSGTIGLPRGVKVTSSENAALQIHGGQTIHSDIRLDNATGFGNMGGIAVDASSRVIDDQTARILGNVDLGAIGSSIGTHQSESSWYGGTVTGRTETRGLEIHGLVEGGTLTVAGAGLQLALLNSSNSYSGATQIREGELKLTEQGRILTSGEIVIQNDTRLLLNNSQGDNLADRVGDSIPISLRGGTLSLSASPRELSTEALGAVNLEYGHSEIENFVGLPNTSHSSRMQLQSLSRNRGATVGFNYAPDHQTHLIDAPTLENGIIGAWATVAGYTNLGWMRQSFATYGQNGVQPLESYEYDINGAESSDNVALGSNTILTDNRTVNSLTATSTNKSLDLNGNALTLESGGLLANGLAIRNGKITASTAGGAELFIHGDADVRADLVDNAGGQVSLVVSGTGEISLRGSNTYSGSTTLSDADVTFDGPQALPEGNDLFIDGAQVTTRNSGPDPRQLGKLSLRNGGQLSGGKFAFSELDLQAGRLRSALTGDGPMKKTTVGTVRLDAGGASYTGTVDIYEGTLTVGDSHSLGVGPVTIHGGQLTAIQDDYGPRIGNDLFVSGGDLFPSGNASLLGNVHVTAPGRIGGIAIAGQLHLDDGIRLRKIADGTLHLTGEIHVRGDSTVQLESGGLSVTGAIHSNASESTLRLTGVQNGDLTLEPSLHVASGQRLSVFVEGELIPLTVSRHTKSVSGGGTLANDLSIGVAAVVSPGDGVGRLSLQSDLLLGEYTPTSTTPDSHYQWEINSATGTAGEPTGWDLIDVGQTLSFDPRLVVPMRIEMIGLDDTGLPGVVEDFDREVAYQWPILSAESIEGFDSRRFAIDASQFVRNNPITDLGQFQVGRVDNDVVLYYDPLGAGSVPLVPGDANQNLKFDQLDLVRVLTSGKYLTGEPATWGDGDWDGGPGGSQGNPPAGDGLFDQLDIVAALAGGEYLRGPYGALVPGGQPQDDQTSIVYDANTGEVAVEPAQGVQLTSINIDSVSAIFTGDRAVGLGGSFDNHTDSNIFKATFGSSFGSISFGEVAQAGLAEEFLLADLTVVGSLAGGGGLATVDLVYVPVPEPSAILLASFALVVLGACPRRFRLRQSAHEKRSHVCVESLEVAHFPNPKPEY